MPLDWQTKLSQLNAALNGSTHVDREIGERLRPHLLSFGQKYAAEWPDSPPDLLIESTEHAEWRALMLTAAADLDQIARIVDGKPAAVLPDDVKLAVGNARIRIQEAAQLPSVSAPYHTLMRNALAVTIPPEPVLYVAGYYAPTHNFSHSSTGALPRQVRFAGDLQRHLSEIMAEVDAWLTTVP